MMPTYTVALILRGSAYITLEADDRDDAIAKAHEEDLTPYLDIEVDRVWTEDE